MNLLDMPLFTARQADGSPTGFLTLEQLLRCQSKGALAHPWHDLSAPSRGLAHALLQTVASQAGLDEDLWLEGVVDGNLDAVADHLFKQNPAKNIKGFSLFGKTGEASFMQMPKDVFPSDATEEPIEGLFQPFRARRGGTAKALRAAQQISGICPNCAAIGLHCLHAYSGSMARYWGASPIRGAVVYHLECTSVGQSLLLNVLHDGSIGAIRSSLPKSELPLPWVANKEDASGRDSDGRLPFEKHLTPSGQVFHPAQGMHPFIRSCRLIEPTEGDVGRCDTCAREGQPLVRRFVLQSENEILKLLSPVTLAALKKAASGEPVGASGILAKSLSKKFVHPALARVQYVPKNTDGAEKNPVRIQQVNGGTEGLSATTPSWLHLVEALSAGLTSMPPVMQQYLCSVETQQALGKDIKLGLFGVQFVGALNPNPKFVLEAMHGASNFLHGQTTANEVAQAADGISKFVKKLLDGWVQGAERLEWTAEQAPGGLKLKAPESASRRKLARSTAMNDPILQGLSARLWAHATTEVGALAQAIALEQDAGQAEGLRAMAKDRLRMQAVAFWELFLSKKSAASSSMAEFFMETAANDAFYRFIASKDATKEAPQTRAIKAR